MENNSFMIGEVILLEHPIAGVPWSTGCYVLCVQTEATATIALVCQDNKGLYAIDNPYQISVEDLAAFTPTGVMARVRK